jgi:hypothetical protein
MSKQWDHLNEADWKELLERLVKYELLPYMARARGSTQYIGVMCGR